MNSIEKKIVFIRHAKSTQNFVSRTPDFVALDRLDSQYVDCPLSEEGIKQCQALKTKFLDIQIDEVIASPLTRALQTANEIFGSKEIKMWVHPLIYERIQCSGDLAQHYEQKKSFVRFDFSGFIKFIQNIEIKCKLVPKEDLELFWQFQSIPYEEVQEQIVKEYIQSIFKFSYIDCDLEITEIKNANTQQKNEILNQIILNNLKHWQPVLKIDCIESDPTIINRQIKFLQGIIKYLEESPITSLACVTHSKFLSYLLTKCGEELIYYDNGSVIEKSLNDLKYLLEDKIVFLKQNQ